MDPFIASLVGALAAGAIAAAKDTTSEAGKDAYKGIREYIKNRYSKVHLGNLEKEPQSKGQQLVVQEKLGAENAQDDPSLVNLAKELVAALKAEAPEAAKAAGVDLNKIYAAIDVQIRRVGDRGPVTIKDIEARRGSVSIEDVGHQGKN